MVAKICDYENRNWEALVHDALPIHETTEMTKHLESCAKCRRKFDLQCAAPAHWTESKKLLQAVASDSEILPLTSIAEIDSQSEQNTVSSKSAHSYSTAILSWLQPPTEPESLGELDGYSIRELIGFGGMGVVLRAWDRKLCRMVAIKVLHPHLATHGTARQRFAREAQAVARISHPNVVPIHDVAAEHQPPYIVMGLVTGGSLQEKIDRDGALSLEESLGIAMQIAEGLVAAHAQGLVHRDVKPANIMMEARWQRVLITDFGLARALDDASLTVSGMLAGTPQFMSPEQANGEDIDARSDLYSLGSVLYTMLTGHPPFRAESAAAVLRRVSQGEFRPAFSVQEQLPEWVQTLLHRLMARDRNQRIATADDAVRLIQGCLHHVQKPSLFSLPEELRKDTQIRVLPWIGGVIGCLAIGFLASQVWSYANSKTPSQQTVGRENTKQLEPASAAKNGATSVDATRLIVIPPSNLDDGSQSGAAQVETKIETIIVAPDAASEIPTDSIDDLLNRMENELQQLEIEFGRVGTK